MKVTLKQILDLKPCSPERVKQIANHHFAGRDEVDLQEVIVLPEVGDIDTCWLASLLLPIESRLRINKLTCSGSNSVNVCFCKCPSLHEFKEIILREINAYDRLSVSEVANHQEVLSGEQTTGCSDSKDD